MLFAYLGLTLFAPLAVYGLALEGVRGDLAVLGVISVTGFVVGFLEQAQPYERAWNVSRGDQTVDVLHVVLSTLGVVFAFELAAQRAPSASVWPVDWPVVVQVVLALLIAEFGAYWAHRWMHTTRLLWRVHVVHHSARRLHSLNSSRNHPLDSLAVLIAAGGPLVALGTPPWVIAPLGAMAIVHLQFQHANTRLTLGALNHVLAGPELHRWHHSRVPEEANANYGHVLIVWDALFGTKKPFDGRRPPVDVGLFAPRDGLAEDYLTHFVEPFRK